MLSLTFIANVIFYGIIGTALGSMLVSKAFWEFMYLMLILAFWVGFVGLFIGLPLMSFLKGF